MRTYALSAVGSPPTRVLQTPSRLRSLIIKRNITSKRAARVYLSRSASWWNCTLLEYIRSGARLAANRRPFLDRTARGEDARAVHTIHLTSLGPIAARAAPHWTYPSRTKVVANSPLRPPPRGAGSLRQRASTKHRLLTSTPIRSRKSAATLPSTECSSSRNRRERQDRRPLLGTLRGAAGRKIRLIGVILSKRASCRGSSMMMDSRCAATSSAFFSSPCWNTPAPAPLLAPPAALSPASSPPCAAHRRASPPTCVGCAVPAPSLLLVNQDHTIAVVCRQILV